MDFSSRFARTRLRPTGAWPRWRARSGANTARSNSANALPTTSSGESERPRSVKQKTGETVFFSYIIYESRADRDRVNAKVMKDKRLAKMMDLKALPSRQSTSARLRPRRSMWACQRSRVGVARRLLGIRHKRAE